MYGTTFLPVTTGISLYAVSSNLCLGVSTFSIIVGLMIFRLFRLKLNERKYLNEQLSIQSKFDIFAYVPQKLSYQVAGGSALYYKKSEEEETCELWK